MDKCSNLKLKVKITWLEESSFPDSKFEQLSVSNFPQVLLLTSHCGR